jgi:hypothetical protein
MKLRPFRNRATAAPSGREKPVAAAPAPPRARDEAPPRVWSLLLPPGFSGNERR